MPSDKEKAANAANKMEYEKRIADYLRTFTSPHGKRVLKDMRRSYCGAIDNERDIGMRQVVKDLEAVLILGKDPQQIEDLFRMPEDDGFEV